MFRSRKRRRFVKIGRMGWAWNAEGLKRGCVVFGFGYGYIKRFEVFRSYPFKKSRCLE